LYIPKLARLAKSRAVIDGKVHECSAIPLFAGGAWQVPVTLAARKKLYKVYRYRNLFHAMVYKKASPQLSSYYQYHDEFVHKLQLVTTNEADMLGKEEHAKCSVCSWWLPSILDLVQMPGWKEWHPGKVGIPLGATQRI